MSNTYHDLNKIVHCRLDSYTWNPNQSVRDRLFADLEPEILTATSAKRRPVILASLFWERYDLAVLEVEIIQPLIAWLQARAAGFHLLLNSAYDYTNHHPWVSVPSRKISAIDFSLLFTARLHDQHQQKLNAAWNPSASRALFLTGKAHKEQRIGLLAKFHDINAVDRLEYSLHINPGIAQRCRSMLDYYSDEQYIAFIERYARNPDNIDIELQPDSSHYHGVPYEPRLYADTVLSIISETSIHDPYALITEKTYRAMLNQHPFVLAGSWHSLGWLESQGFKTFQEYLPIKRYDTLPPASRLDSIVNNTLAFLDRDRGYDDLILKDIDHNFHALQARLHSERAKLRDIMLKYVSQVPDNTVNALISAF